MRVTCERCGAAYRVDDARVPAGGARFKCAACENVFVIRPGGASDESTPVDLMVPASETTYIVRAVHGDPLGRFTEAQIARRMAHGEMVGTEEVSTDGDTWAPVISLPAVDRVLRGDLAPTAEHRGVGAPLPPTAEAQEVGAPLPPSAELQGVGGPEPRPTPRPPPLPPEAIRSAAPGATLMGPGGGPAPPPIPKDTSARATAATIVASPSSLYPRAPADLDALDLPAPHPSGTFPLAPTASAPPAAAAAPLPPTVGAKPAPPAPVALDLDIPDLPAPREGGAAHAAAGPVSSQFLDIDDLDLPAPRPTQARPPAPPAAAIPAAPPPPPETDSSFSLDDLDLPAPRPSQAGSQAAAAGPISFDGLLPARPAPIPMTQAASPPPAAVDPLLGLDDFDLPVPRGTAGPPPAVAERPAAPPGDGLDDLDLLRPPTAASTPSPQIDLDDLDLPSGTQDQRPAAPSEAPRAPSGAAPARSLDDLDLLLDEPDLAGAGARPKSAASLSLSAPAATEMDAFDFAEPAPRLAAEFAGPAAPVELGEPAVAVSAGAGAFDQPVTTIEAAEFAAPEAPTVEAPRRRFLLVLGIGLGGFLALVLVVGGVLANFYTEHGFFWYYLATNQPLAERSGARALVDRAQREAMRDTPDAYRKAIAMCDDARKRAPSFVEATAVRAQLRLALLQRFGADPEQSALARTDLGALSSVKKGDDAALYERDKARSLDMLAAGRAREAAGQLENLERRGAADPWRAIFQGWALLKSRKAAEAEQAFARAVRIDPLSDAAAYGHGIASLALGKRTEAKADFEAVFGRNAAHASSVLELGEIAWRAGDGEGAKKRLDPLLAGGVSSQRARALAVLGEMAYAAADLNDARDRFEAALKLDPKNVQALTGLGRLLYEGGRPGDALARCRDAKTIEPLNTEAALCVVRASIRLVRLLEARVEVEEILKRDPNLAEARFLLGQVAEAQDQIDEAVEGYKNALVTRPDLFPAYLHLARLHVKQKRQAEALAVLKEARQKIGDRAEVWSGMGEVHLAAGRLGEARVAFVSALEKDPRLHQARFNLANLLVAEGRTGEAIAEYEKVRAQAMDFPGLAEKLGLLYIARGETGKAVAEMERALAAEGPSHELRLAAAQAFVVVGRYADAGTQAEMVLRDRPASADAHHLAGVALLGQERTSEAIIELRQALNLEKKGRFLYSLGRAYEKAKKEDDALTAYDEAVRLDRTMVDTRVAAARLRMDRGTYRDAMAGLVEAARHAPKRGDIGVMIGDCALNLGDHAAALAAYAEAARREPTLGEAHFKLGQELRDAGRVREALVHLSRAVELAKPLDRPEWLPDAWGDLGWAYRGAGQDRQAAEAFKKYLDMKPDAPDREEVLREIRWLSSGG